MTSPAPTELLATWTFDNNETSHFQVVWSSPTETATSSATTSNTSYTITALTPCTVYAVSVTALDDANNTLGLSGNETATTATPATNVSAVAVDAVVNQSSLLDVSWQTEDDLTNCSTNFSVTWARLDDPTLDEFLTADLEYTIVGLDAFTSYNVCVATCLDDAFKYPVCGVNTTKEDVPSRPVNVTARATGAETLLVGWEEPDEPNGVVIGYTLIWTHATTRDVDTLQVNGNTTAAVISELQPCTAYTITVSASTAAGSGKQGGPAFATTESAAPSCPTHVNISQVDGQPDALNVTWTQATAFGHCNVTSNTVTWWLASSGDLVGNKTIPATVQVTLDGLQPSTTYSVGVSAAVNDVSGLTSECVNRTTGPADSSGPKTPSWWIIGLSVAVVVLLTVVCIAIYVFRDKLKMLKPRPRVSSSYSHSGLGLGSLSPSSHVYAAAGEVRTRDLRNYIKRLEDDTQRGLEEEFEEVRQQSYQHPTTAAVQDRNRAKNRFRNILPFDHSRVVLPLLPGEPYSDYINANYIKDARGRQRFVACQGPTASTVRDFWRLAWQVDASVVVMLTNLREKGRERCALYWPTAEEPYLVVGDLTIRRCGESGGDGLRVREFLLQRGEKQRPLRQYHLTTWPDFGVPSHEHHLLDFMREVRNFLSPASGPLVVHCSAGVGRTGTFIGLWNLMETVDDGPPASINVQGTVLAMRECRPTMVQSPEQYLYLYKCIAAYLEEPHRWRTREEDGTGMFAYDNPVFTGEATSSGRHASHGPAGGWQRKEF